jgi:cholesterol oxidase
VTVAAPSRPRERRPLRLPEPAVHEFETADGVGLRLTRYQGGDRGPVICAPGFGTSSLAFSIDTVDTNLPEFLVERGFDVWLLDYRASPELPSSQTQFSVDEVATADWPAAVATTLAVTGASDVQVVAHCVGSMSFLMAGLSGLEGVRSAVCSCLGLHPLPARLNTARAWMHIASLASRVGLKRMSSDFDPKQLDDQLVDKLLWLYPSHERCDSPVCRRILFMYGDVYAHEQLNDATHGAIHEIFGTANAATLAHVSLMIRRGRVVDRHGNDTYLPHLERLAFPIAFVHGERNHLYVPEGTRRTFELLRSINGDDLYRRHVIAGYSHMDCWIGEHAARDVFPIALAELEAHP